MSLRAACTAWNINPDIYETRGYNVNLYVISKDAPEQARAFFFARKDALSGVKACLDSALTVLGRAPNKAEVVAAVARDCIPGVLGSASDTDIGNLRTATLLFVSFFPELVDSFNGNDPLMTNILICTDAKGAYLAHHRSDTPLTSTEVAYLAEKCGFNQPQL